MHLDPAALGRRGADRIERLDDVRGVLAVRAGRTALAGRVGEVDERTAPVDPGVRLAQELDRLIVAAVRELERRVRPVPRRHVETAVVAVQLEAVLLRGLDVER